MVGSAFYLTHQEANTTIETHRHTHLFGGLLSAIVDPPTQAGPPAGDVAAHLKLPRHRVAHDGTGDVGGHLGDGTFELVQHGLHVGGC